MRIYQCDTALGSRINVCVCVCVSGEGGVALIGDPRVIVLLICCEKYCYCEDWAIWFWYVLLDFCVCTAHHFILLKLKFLNLRRDRWWLKQSVSRLRVWLSAKGVENFSWLLLTLRQRWVSLNVIFIAKFLWICLKPDSHLICFICFNKSLIKNIIKLFKTNII